MKGMNVLDISDQILKSILKKSSLMKKENGEELKSIFNNFYAVLWNHFRDHYEQLPSAESLKIVKQSLCWLALQGIENYHVIRHKLNQVNYLITKTTSYVEIDQFLSGFMEYLAMVSKEVTIF